MNTLHDIGAALRHYRKKRGVTLSSLAESSHIHRNTLSALENGVGNVELNTLLAVCEQLGLQLSLVPGRLAFLGAEATVPKEPKGAADKASPSRTVNNPQVDPTRTALQRRVSNRLAAASTKDVEGGPGAVRLFQAKLRAEGEPRTQFVAFRSGVIDERRAPELTALQKRISARLAASGKPDQKGRK